MEFIHKVLYNWESLKIFFGAFSALVLVVMVNCIKIRWNYYTTKNSLKKDIEINPNNQYKYGDLDQYLRTIIKIEVVDLNKEIISNSIQPLLIVVLINILDPINVFLLFGCVINRKSGFYMYSLQAPLLELSGNYIPAKPTIF